MQRHRFAGHQVNGSAEQRPHHVPLTDVLGKGAAGAERQHVVPPIDNRNRHRLWLVFLHMAAPALAGHQQFGDLVAVDDLAAVETNVVASGYLVFGDDAAEGVDVAAAVLTVPLRDGELPQIDVVAFDDVLFDRARVDNAWWDGLLNASRK